MAGIKGLKLGSMHLNINIEKVIKIGSIKVSCTICTCVGRYGTNASEKQKEQGFDWKKGDLWFEIQDHFIDQIKYNGVVIESYENLRKFKDFHNEMGIDIDDHVDKGLDTNNLTIDDALALININPKDIK